MGQRQAPDQRKLFPLGMLEGACVYYDDDSKLLAKGAYHHGKKHGTWYYFNDNKVTLKEQYRYGTLESETSYDE